MKNPRQHLRLSFARKTPVDAAPSRLDASRKRLLALAFGASLGATSGCGDSEPIPPMPGDAGDLWDAGTLDDTGLTNDAGEWSDASEESDAGEWSDAGEERDSGADDSGPIPPMPQPQRDAATADLGPIMVDVGRTEQDSGEVPPMPPPRDAGVSVRDVGPASRDVRREP